MSDERAVAWSGWAAEEHHGVLVGEDMVLTAFCLFFPETNLSRPLCPAAGRRTRISVPWVIPVFPLTPSQQASTS
ncbi:hypothetical protein ACIOMM_35965 [Streptomyces sp. NPDC087908]|uniref:hypothetical protein n=1 Tax=Streptomyces sp. NPDC087908 TaxID=3365820 RepID=UPI0037FAE6DF